MSQSRQDKAFQILAQRSVWEQKQRLYYQMRHDGLRRINKPWPTAADSHFPMIDMIIANLKPFWMAQAFSGERLADFICMQQQLADMTEAAADFMDYELRYRTDFRYRMEQAVDTMLLRGRGILKIVYDPVKKKLVFKNVDPLYLLMAEQYDDFEDADYWVEVRTLSVAQYQRNPNYDQSADVLNAIRGRSDWNLAAIKLDKQIREGITHSSKDEQIILWEYYERTESGVVVRTHCPLAWDKHIRDPYEVIYEWDGVTLSPYYSITMEIKDEGWYSPRGIAELNAQFETYACKLWNDKSDAMTFGNKPLFTTDQADIQNSGNMHFMPGELIPGNIKAVQMPQPAFSFGEEINFTRELAEQRSKMPDYGIQGGPTDGKPRTATENNRIAGLQDVGSDHNGDIFRNVRLSKIFRHCWALICHREDLEAKGSGKPGPLTYFVGDNLKELPRQALHDQYLVLPAGSSGTKQGRLQRAGGRYQMFKGAPNIDQDELARSVIAADDSRLVKKLLISTSQKAASEAFQEDVELVVMSYGRPVPVLPGQDHATRIMEIVGYLQKQHVTGAPVDPMAKAVITQHLMEHFQYLKQLQPQVAKQMAMQIAAMEQQATSVGGNGQGPAPGGGPGPAMPAGQAGAGAPGPSPPGGGGTPAKESVSINYKDAPEDIKRQMEAAAGFTPSTVGTATMPAPESGGNPS